MGLWQTIDNEFLGNGTPSSANNPNFKGSNPPPKIDLKAKQLTTDALRTFKSVGGGVAPLASEFFLPAFIAKLGLDAVIPSIKQAYYDKMEENGIPLPSNIASDPLPEPEPITPPTPEPFVTPPEPATTLMDVLANNGNSVSHNVAENAKFTEYIGKAIERATETLTRNLQTLNTSIQSLTVAVVNDTDINSAYKELDLSDSVYDRDIDIAYKDTNLSNNIDMTNAVESLSDNVSSLKNGVKIEKSQVEETLIAKKLGHIEFDTTPIQVDNLGDNIPVLTPQQMRAVKDAVVAKKNSDENTFSIDDSDIEDGLSISEVNIAEIFDRWSATLRNEEILTPATI